MPEELQFPKPFLWGAATAAYQIEGAAAEDGRQESIWDTFCRIPGAVVDSHNGSSACDHYHRYSEDIALMKELNLGAYRFSVSWPRVRPDGGAANPRGLDFYSRLVDGLLEADIAPWLTLYHWDLPQILEDRGGWANRDTAYAFAEYAASVHERLGDRVRVWSTLNEPWCSAFLGYCSGVHAPGRQSRPDALAAMHHLLLGHGLAADELRRRDPQARLGLTLNLTVADPSDPADPVDVDAARRIDSQFNRVFLDPVFHGTYPADFLADVAPYGLERHIRPGDLELIGAPIDFLGVNYYHGESVTGHPVTDQLEAHNAPVQRPTASPYPAADNVAVMPRGLPTTAMGWEVQPEGLYRLLLRLQAEYAGPSGTALYVTENGAAYEDVVQADGSVQDTERLEFFRAHVAQCHRAIGAGVDLRGYFAWSLLDNFEWAWGYHKRFGLVRVDYATFERTVKASGRWFGRAAAANSITEPAGCRQQNARPE
ncbi:broad-specificity cellobiase [Arthrobacter crystallopoietes BAB-32]|uniref:Beta-glucosidase n=1 Tax=Arthrobacter crystallopoietes BAB-32 TaxID=1246476 RepID=N1UX26_9MICC|nr:GH1 family beta-glucosidase [Arthrobacter crystallopoietes]EMY33620.1 broad-specificity cellobiase [Arthrobacter crystallopoietes BAB-32]